MSSMRRTIKRNGKKPRRVRFDVETYSLTGRTISTKPLIQQIGPRGETAIQLGRLIQASFETHWSPPRPPC